LPVILLSLSSFVYLESNIFKNEKRETFKKVSSQELWKNKITAVLKEELRIGSDDLDQEQYIFGIINDIKIDKNECIYILDSANFRVQKYSPEGKFLRTFGKGRGEGPGEFLRPKFLTVDHRNNIYVADINQMRITMFNPAGDVIKTMKTKGQPAFMIAGDKNELYLTKLFDYGDFMIYVYNLDTGEIVNTFCEKTKEDMIITEAGDTAILCGDGKGNIYCSFSYPYEIRKYSPVGKLLCSFSRRADFFKPPIKDRFGVLSLISRSIALAILPEQKVLHVVGHRDLNSNKISFFFDIFDHEGNWLLSFPSAELNTEWVRKVTTDSEGNLYLDYMEPFPHIRKFSLKFIEKTLSALPPRPNARKSKR
jgi:hypothetical protein